VQFGTLRAKTPPRGHTEKLIERAIYETQSHYLVLNKHIENFLDSTFYMKEKIIQSALFLLARRVKCWSRRNDDTHALPTADLSAHVKLFGKVPKNDKWDLHPQRVGHPTRKLNEKSENHHNFNF
jgi:hypothetical protein